MILFPIAVGGGESREIDRLRASSWWAFLEWEGARCGTAGVSRIGASVALLAVESLVRGSKKLVVTDVSGVLGDDSSIEEVSADVAGVLIKLREM